MVVTVGAVTVSPHAAAVSAAADVGPMCVRNVPLLLGIGTFSIHTDVCVCAFPCIGSY